MSEAKRNERQVKPLVLHLKKEYWQQIKDGTKTVEYRERGPYWDMRLRNREYSEVHLLLGYPKRGDTSKLIRRKWNGFIEIDIEHPHFGGTACVFAIDVSNRIECDCINPMTGDPNRMSCKSCNGTGYV